MHAKDSWCPAESWCREKTEFGLRQSISLERFTPKRYLFGGTDTGAWILPREVGSGTDSEFRATFKPQHVVTEPACVTSLDYLTLQSPSVARELTLKPTRASRANGYGLWFDSELVEGVFMSSAPGHSKAEYVGRIYPKHVRAMARAGGN